MNPNIPTLDELWGRLVTDDILIIPPHDQSVHWSGAHILMLAVLHDAVKRYQEGYRLERIKGRNRTRAKNQGEEAALWFADTDDDLLYSFENICDMLHLDAGGIRRGLKAWATQTEIPPRRRQRRYSKRQGTIAQAA